MELNNKYFQKAIELKRIKMVFMGKDPFPKGATGIPFIKECWADMERGSGCVVISKIADLVKYNFNKKKSPEEVAFDLLQIHHVVLLNLSYENIQENGKNRPIRKLKDEQALENAHKINKPILEKADKVFLLGEARKLAWHENIALKKYFCVCHPDIRNSINPKTKEEWNQFWRIKNK